MYSKLNTICCEQKNPSHLVGVKPKLWLSFLPCCDNPASQTKRKCKGLCPWEIELTGELLSFADCCDRLMGVKSCSRGRIAESHLLGKLIAQGGMLIFSFWRLQWQINREKICMDKFDSSLLEWRLWQFILFQSSCTENACFNQEVFCSARDEYIKVMSKW